MSQLIAELNPFSSRFVSPASCDFVADENNGQLLDDGEAKLRRFRSLQIIGPHGSGKSATAVELARRIRNRLAIVLYTVRIQHRWRRGPHVSTMALDQREAGQARWQARWGTDAAPRRISILDGLETLSLLHRILVLRALRRNSDYVIVTTHRRFLWIRPTLILRPSPEQFRAIAHRLLRHHPHSIDNKMIDSIYRHCGGNYRTGLARLYDEFSAVSALPQNPETERHGYVRVNDSSASIHR